MSSPKMAEDGRPGRLFVFGLGYSAMALARTLLAEGWHVAGTTRDPAKAEALAAMGIAPYLFGADRPLADPAAALAGTTHLLDGIPPGTTGDPVLRHHAADIARIEGLRWVGYLSTTAVYGDTGGAWVDEDSPTNPGTERGRERLAAELGWRALMRDHGLPVHIFRIAGIYGPGRSAIDQVRAGTARRWVKPGQVFSRIHVDDIARVLHASMAAPEPGQVFNLADTEPAPTPDVVAFAAGLLGMAPPPEQPYDPTTATPMQRSFYSENKRVRAEKIGQVLGVTLAHPTYREGLRAQRAAEEAATGAQG